MPIEFKEAPFPEKPAIRGLADEIRYLIETGSPRSLASALELIRGRGLGSSEFGRMMNAAAAALINSLYPDSRIQYLPPDPPLTGAYTRILKNAGQGIYAGPPSASRDFLEYTLPFLAYYSKNALLHDTAILKAALPALDTAARLNRNSILPFLFRAFIFEYNNDPAGAEKEYRNVLTLAADCYPAELGLVRIMDRKGEKEEAFSRLSELLDLYPENPGVKKALARVYTARKDWANAETLLEEILRDANDGEFLLMKALLMIETGRYQEAQVPLDSFSSIDPGNPQYLFLRARLQAEFYRNRDLALNYLRTIVRSRTNDTEALVYMAGLLFQSARPEDAAEGKSILERLLARNDPSPEILALGVRNAIQNEAWEEAAALLSKLLEKRRENGDLYSAYRVERGRGNKAEALAFARELYALNPGGNNASSAYITALIESGNRTEAARIIEQRLSQVTGSQKSRYYYLRSSLRMREEDELSDLRLSLFEDPRNQEALAAMFELYHRRKDTRRAVNYLKQALALDPGNPSLKNYEREYRELLGPAY